MNYTCLGRLCSPVRLGSIHTLGSPGGSLAAGITAAFECCRSFEHDLKCICWLYFKDLREMPPAQHFFKPLFHCRQHP